MREVIPVNEHCILREAGMPDIFVCSWSISQQLEAPRPRPAQPRSLSRCSGSGRAHRVALRPSVLQCHIVLCGDRG